MPNIENWEVFGLESSIFRSGYPMLPKPPTKIEYLSGVEDISYNIAIKNYENHHIKRAINLANAKGGGHDQFLTGIVVNFDLRIANKAWVDAERYTFLNFISSMSTMHRISVFGIEDCCNGYVDGRIIEIANEKQKQYNEIDGLKFPEEKAEAYLELLYNIPSGFEVMAGMTTNYRCLKNIYSQRKNHRLPDFWAIRDWIHLLPMSDVLITGKGLVKPSES